jgi:putative nucleotidyltransferase with HDIG domain
MDIAEDEIKWAGLLHDIGKIKTKTEDDQGIHYYGHDIEGAKIAESILERLRFSKKEISRISNLIRWHMFYYPSGEWRKENGLDGIYNDDSNNRHGWSDGAIRRFIKNVGGVDQLDDLIKLRIADAGSNKLSHFDPTEIEALQQRISEVYEKDMALKVSDLQIGGEELKKLGYTPGPKFNEILSYLLEIVIEDPSKNNKDDLLSIIKKNFPN